MNVSSSTARLMPLASPFQMQKSVLSSCLTIITALIGATSNVSLAQSTLFLSSDVTSQGGTVALSLSLTSPTGSEPTGIQWTLSYPAASIASISVTAGPALISAGESITCAAHAGS